MDDPAATVAEMARCLRPGGTLASLEFYRAAAAAVAGVLVAATPGWRCRCSAALTGGAAWYRVGRFLGPSISVHYQRHPLDDHIAAWRAAGLTDIGVSVMSLGGGLVMWGRKGAPPAGPGS